MNDFFQLAGPISRQNQKFYIERSADQDVLRCLLRGDMVTVIEPRQQGKTSLVFALTRHPAMQFLPVLYIDVSTIKKDSPEEWYENFCERLLELFFFLPQDARPPLAKDAGSFRNFLARLCQSLTRLDKSVIIALDEVAALQFPGSTGFFSVLRDIFNSREAERYLQQINFLLVGAFSPQDLIKDPRVSPFNVAIRVFLPDFQLDEVLRLVQGYGWNGSLAEELASRIHFWTEGQPYLSQTLCTRASRDPLHQQIMNREISLTMAVDQQVDDLFRSDDNHICSLRNRLDLTMREQPGLAVELRTIAAGEGPSFCPAVIRWQEQLQLLGVIKDGPNHNCQIRNLIYHRLVDIWFRSWSSIDGLTPTNEKTFVQQRLNDLTERLSADLELLDDYEKNIHLTDDARARARWMVEVKSLFEVFPAYQQEFEILRSEAQKDVLHSIREIELRLKILSTHYEFLLKNSGSV
jgi:hypothetical protein